MSCTFCELLAKPDRDFVYDGYLWFAFQPIGPINDGHVLFVPKRHVSRIEELDDKDWLHLQWPLISYVTQFNNYNIGINAGRIAGQTVFHLHIHVIPRTEGDVEDVAGGIVGALGEKIEGSQMDEYLESLKND